MSETERQADGAGPDVTGPDVTGEELSPKDAPHAIEPTVTTGVAEPASAGAVTDRAGSDSAPKEATSPEADGLQASDEQVRRLMRQKTRRSFLRLGAGFLVGFGAWRWLMTRREIDGIPWPFRKVLEVNEQFARDYFSTRRLSPPFARNRISADRVNGDIGLDEEIDSNTWKLRVEGLASQSHALELSLDAIKQLPRTEMITEFRCIEGWSVVVRWAGARFTDFMKAYPPSTISGEKFALSHPGDLPPYVSMETPDREYYVGLDMASMLHPQTLLCYERNGDPLSQDHGAPLRLVIPVKYGVKNLKRIGGIRYSRLRPTDYWAERGYDWYVGL